MRQTTFFAVLVHLIAVAPRPIAARCYYDSWGYRYCDSYLSYAARVGIAVGVLALSFFLILMILLLKRRRSQARNAILLQQQQQNPWTGPPGYGQPAPPYTAPVTPGYGIAPPGATGYNNPTPQPFQPGYTGGYAPPAGPPGGVRGYDVNPTGSPPLQEPPKTYDPNQPFNNANPGSNVKSTEPPSNSWFAAPPGSPPTTQPQNQQNANSPYNYVPPEKLV